MGIGIADRLRNFGSQFVSGLYVAQCAECNRRGRWVCPDCARRLLPWAAVACARCGSDTVLGCVCDRMPDELQLMTAAFPLDGWARSAVHRFKYSGEFARSQHLASFVTPLVESCGGVDLLVPVPLHRDRKRTRGYNQALLLARDIARSTGIPVADVVRRRSHRRHQVGQGREERWNGSLDAFACEDHLVRGKRIVLIDDVITTGATMAGCAGALADAGAASIVAVAFARG